MMQGNKIFCDICMTKNDFDDSYCRECGEKLVTKKLLNSQNGDTHRNKLKIDRQFVNSINSSVYEKDDDHVKYEVKNKINFIDKLYIAMVLIVGIFFWIAILLAIIISPISESQDGSITFIYSAILFISIIIILLAMSQLIVNKTVKINIKSHHYNKNVGLIKAKGLLLKHWMFFDPNGHELYSMIFSTRKRGILFGKKEKYSFSILNKDLLKAQAFNDDETKSINVLSGDRKSQTFKKSVIHGRKTYTVDDNEDIDDSLALFFALVVMKRNN